MAPPKPAGRRDSDDQRSCSINTDMIRPFDGTGDIVAWIKKVKLVAKLKGVEDVASLLPLYLEGDALALYLELGETEQLNLRSIEEKLKTAFADGPFEAYARLMKKRWSGETVDVYMTELRRLAGLSGFSGIGLETCVRLSFVNGMPDNIGSVLQQMPDVRTTSLSELLSRARVLVSKQPHYAAVAATSDNRMSLKNSYSDKQNGREVINVFKGKCFRCGGPHAIKYCKERRMGITCFKCGKIGHMMAQCFADSENYQRGTGAPAVSPVME